MLAVEHVCYAQRAHNKHVHVLWSLYITIRLFIVHVTHKCRLYHDSLHGPPPYRPRAIIVSVT